MDSPVLLWDGPPDVLGNIGLELHAGRKLDHTTEEVLVILAHQIVGDEEHETCSYQCCKQDIVHCTISRLYNQTRTGHCTMNALFTLLQISNTILPYQAMPRAKAGTNSCG